jgi:endonuclease/exonuclease/phosphatase family metal-dependent hydrolase
LDAGPSPFFVLLEKKRCAKYASKIKPIVNESKPVFDIMFLCFLKRHKSYEAHNRNAKSLCGTLKFRGGHMPRLMAYNIEWFDDAFKKDNTPGDTAEARKQLDAAAEVIQHIDPDLIGITEAPNTTTTTGEQDTVKALENFASDKGLRQSKALIGFPSPGRQEISILFDPNVFEVEHDPGGSPGTQKNPPFKEQFYVDSDEDGIKEVYKHYRPPLEAKVKPKSGGTSFWIMVVHAKSKGIFNAMDRVHFERTSERNRRKLFAECSSIRRRVDEWLAKDRPVVVMGDINDGPGFDFYEERFGRSAVELIMGSIFSPDDILRNVVGAPKWGRFGWEPSSARFPDPFTNDRVNALIDHIMVSRHLKFQEEGYVWNPFQNEAAKDIKDHLVKASDHFPITVDII